MSTTSIGTTPELSTSTASMLDDQPNRVDPITVGVISSRLTSILNEQQSALVNTAFSPVVRESFDLACAAFDSKGDMIGQSVGGTPGHINAMATGMHHIVSEYPPEVIRPGDVMVTNDPWMTSGQINDITIATPVFKGERLVAWFASCCHSPDIGGRILSAQATEIYEEGLRLPIMKFLEEGVLNSDLNKIIRINVRTPDETIGDMYAQVAGNEVGARSLLRLMDEFDLNSIDPVAEEIINRSERALREALRAVPDGVYTAETSTDGFGDEPITLKVAATVDGGDIYLDFAGSSPQSRYGINVVLNYTRAYSSFAIKAAFAPEVPHNHGSFKPVHVTAPEGSIVNAQPPAPVAARHLVGHFLPSLLFAALRPALPNKLLAYSADANWLTVWTGHTPVEREPFTFTMFHAGGMGARSTKDGLSSTGFPGGLRVIPSEVTETLTPLIQRSRTLTQDSGGAGRWRGGLGQTSTFECRGDGAWTVAINGDRISHPAQGVGGGLPGGTGQFGYVDGRRLPVKQHVRLGGREAITLKLPGGGGYGSPHERSVQTVLADVVDGYVSLEAAREHYGVVIEYIGDPKALVRPPSTYCIDEAATAALRSGTTTGSPA